jgi:hypothetical protein
MQAAEEVSLTPRPARNRSMSERTMGWAQRISTSVEKNYRSRSSTPRGERNRSIAARTMGVMLMTSAPVNEDGEKNYRSRTSTRRGEERDSGLRTMGVDHVDAS